MRSHLVAFSITAVAVSLVFGACAKRPAITLAPAPPPAAETRVVPPTPPPAAPAPAPVAPAPAPVAPAPPPPTPAPPVAAAEPRPAPTEFRADANVRTVYFAFDKAVIRPGDAKILDANAAWLKQHDVLLMIEGHCDERGTEQYNLALGERRAVAVMQYLRDHGVAADRMSLVSYGEEAPACQAHTEACWSKNRRAQFKIKER
jgi:peptidoglycan-associated lipoprotein